LEGRARALAAQHAAAAAADAADAPDAADSARGGERQDDERQDDEPLSRTQEANLVLVLLVTQALQVLLLAVAVFAFFIGFGLLAIRPAVVLAWVGHPPTPVVWHLAGVTARMPVSNELYQVSVFLSAFAGLYFTVYAVSDAGYREQFFAELALGLERAVGVRSVYRALLAVRDGAGRDHPDSAGDHLP
jgi:hypothetical protein